MPRINITTNLKKMGLSKREVLTMPSEDLKALLSGRTTNLHTIHVKEQLVERTIQMKFTVQRFLDVSLSLMIHPIRKEIQIVDNLSDSLLYNERGMKLLVF